MNQAAQLNTFRREAVSTAPPAKLLTMLYDRLVLDLDRAGAAVEAGDRGSVNAQIGHAQQIIAELRCSLDVDIWDGAPHLLALYNFLYTELVTASVTNDRTRIVACRDLVVPLRDAWHQAAATTPAATTTSDTGVG